MKLNKLFKYYLFWIFLIIFISFLGFYTLPFQSRFTYLSGSFDVVNIIKTWSNFDGVHYLDIAKYWYGSSFTDKDYVFFPVYPLLIRLFNFADNPYLVALLISQLSFFIALYYLYKLLKLDFSEKISQLSIFLLLIFPTSFFFGSVYTESFFLLISVLSFYFIREKQFLLGCVFAAIASATRVTGIFIWPAIFIEYLYFSKFNVKNVLRKEVLSFSLPPLGLLSYLYYQYIKTGDALFFIHIQSNFAGRSTEKLVLLPQVFYRYFKIIFTTKPDPVFFTAILELLCSLFVLILIIYGIKKIRISYLLYVSAAYILPTLTGTFLSIPRFVIVLFPLFPVLATWLINQKPLVRYLYIGISILLAAFSIVVFSHGYFIS